MAKTMTYPTETLDPSELTGLIVAGMGGPDSQAAVEPFLRNLFRDPAVLPLPRPISRLVGAMIVRRRAGEVRRRYESLGHNGGSPQLSWTLRQCAELRRLMVARGLRVFAEPAMRYWHPFPEETVKSLLDRGARQFLLVPAFPQYSEATSGSVLTATLEALRSFAPAVPVHVVRDWHLLPGYIDALASMAEPVLRRWCDEGRTANECALLPVAHSLPERFIRKGDPYLEQTRATVGMLRSRLEGSFSDSIDWWKSLPGGGEPLLAFQSKVGPVKWVGPEVSAEVNRLASRGCRRLVVLPVSFTCEHIETLHELDVDLAAGARRAGIREFLRVETLNLNSRWLASLAEHLGASPFAVGEGLESTALKGACHA